jgi:hypothetical protein
VVLQQINPELVPRRKMLRNGIVGTDGETLRKDEVWDYGLTLKTTPRGVVDANTVFTSEEMTARLKAIRSAIIADLKRKGRTFESLVKEDHLESRTPNASAFRSRQPGRSKAAHRSKRERFAGLGGLLPQVPADQVGSRTLPLPADPPSGASGGAEAQAGGGEAGGEG